MKNYWLIRLSHEWEASWNLYEKENLISIGFSAMLDESGCFEIEEYRDDWHLFDDAIIEKYGAKLRSRHNLWKFLYDLKQGDVVILPFSKGFHIVEIMDDQVMTVSDIDSFLLQSDRAIDLGFFRIVKPICENLSRDGYTTNPLNLRMKVRSGFVSLNDLNEDVEEAISRGKQNKPINIYRNVRAKMIEIIEGEFNHYVEANGFEKLVKRYFEEIGASDVSITPKNHGKGGDADIIAVFDPLKTIFMVQAKKYDGETSAHAVEQINEYGSKEDESETDYSIVRWVVSFGETYSKKAIQLAKENNIQLINRQGFIEMVVDAGIDILKM